ncbi:MAG: PAS domain S-box protein, partial [Cyclobacteriaceae bacterium]|nr:PAS domain S-box protein [Cyclobacteriaceae bacterium]
MMKYNELSFQLMVDASPIALMLVNKHGKIVYLNRYTEKLFLYDKEEIIGKDIGILMNEKYRSKHPKLLSGYFENPTSRSMGLNRELYAQKKNGVEFPVEIGLNPIVTVDGTLALAAINDITDRKIAKEQFRLVVESAPNAMLLVDDLGKIVMVNRQTEILFKYKQNELINKKIEMLMPENLRTHHPDLRENFHSDPQARPMGIGRDLVALKKDGTEFPIEIGLNPIVKNDGNFVLASIIDITQRKKNEESFKSFAKQLETKNKQLEEYTNIASHDLREPLNSITVLIKLLVEDEKNKLDEETFETLNLISQSASRMNSLIIGLLDYARLGETPRVKSIDFNEMVDVVLQDLSSSIKASNAKIKVNK